MTTHDQPQFLQQPRVLYVYYRTPAQAAVIQPQLLAFLARVQQVTGIQGELSCRVSAQDDSLTWLECYRHVPEAFAEALDQLWQDAEIDKQDFGPRRLELFYTIT